MSLLLTFYIGIGVGIVIWALLIDGLPCDWRDVIDLCLCPLLWPIAVVRRLL